MKHEALFELWAEGMLVVDSHAHGMWWDTRPRIADAGGVMEVPVSEMQRELSIYGAEQKHGRERKLRVALTSVGVVTCLCVLGVGGAGGTSWRTALSNALCQAVDRVGHRGFRCDAPEPLFESCDGRYRV